MSSFETMIYEKHDGIAHISLNRPHVLNVYNMQMRDELSQILSAIKDDPDILVVILKGEGEQAFCAGADLSEFLTAPSPVIARQVRFERDVWRLFGDIPQPIIAALHGYVLGSGIEMALCCDMRIASDDTHFGLPEVSLGIIPAAGGTQTLPRLIGRGKALEMMLEGCMIDAKEAFEIGLVNRVVTKNVLLAIAGELARQIAVFDPAAVRAIKQAVVRGLDLPLSDGLNLEKMLASTLMHLKMSDASE